MHSGDQILESTRFERKYRCSIDQYLRVKNALYPYLRNDFFSQKASEKRYLVRSLYFDTPNYQLFLEKVGGLSHREKFRIRTYNTSLESKPDIRVEIKSRQGNLTKKYGAYLSLDDYCSFLKYRHWDNEDAPVLLEFQRKRHLLNLLPKLLVEYFREGFHSNDGNNIRITFDHRVKSARANTLFPKHIFWHVHHEQLVVMEIKHQRPIPEWLSKTVESHGLRLVSNSKFSLGIQACQPDIIHAGWSHS